MKFNRILTLEEIAEMYCEICPNCGRKVPNVNFFTKNVKCRWCDAEYYEKEND